MKKAAFIFDGIPHPVKDSVLNILKKNFPQHQFEVINLLSVLKKHKFIVLINAFFIIAEYWKHLIYGKRTMKFYMMRTSYIFMQIKRIVSKYLKKNNFDFSFEIMLMQDISAVGIPNFTYNDIVHISYFDFPSVVKWHQNSESWLKLEKTIYQNAAMNFTWSTNTAEDMHTKYDIPKEKIVCVNAGGNVPPPKNPNFNESRYSSKNIVFVGRDWDRKGGNELIKAFRIVREKLPDATLTVIGCTPQIEEKNVNILGKLSLEEVGKHYEKAALFCLPTKREPFGNVFIEAMFYKLPIISLNLGATIDFVINDFNGYRVPYDNIEELASKIISVISDPIKCKTFGENSYKLAAENYDWEIIGNKMKSHIEKFL